MAVAAFLLIRAIAPRDGLDLTVVPQYVGKAISRKVPMGAIRFDRQPILRGVEILEVRAVMNARGVQSHNG
jgi:hypothetical protein